MVREIITDIENLTYRSDECDIRKNSKAIRGTVVDLKETMKQNNLPALCGPQIGIPIRVIVLNIDGRYKALCNPFITEANGFTLAREADPCFPGKQFIVPRYNKIVVNYLNPLGKIESKQLIGLGAYLLQQCVDHLEGIVVDEIGMEVDEDFDNATEDERAQVIKYFMESLDIRYQDLQKEIEEDPEAKKLSDAIKFMQASQRGEIEFDEPLTVVKEIDRKEEENNE